MSDFTAKDLGARCRKFRDARGMSQEKLGEKIGVLGATISKYEREGIRDIELINRISRVLGCDLLNDEIDEEGIVGEVGKEILFKLIENKGWLEYSFLVNTMLGMSESRVSNEIFKLLKIGMCVREQFKDFEDNEKDIVFITAKGLITSKNHVSNPLLEKRLADKYKDVITYEMMLKADKNKNIPDAGSYQEYVELRPVEKLIRNLEIPDSLYRADFVLYLLNNFTTGFDKVELNKEIRNLLPCENFYYDCLHRMALKIDNDELLYRLNPQKWAEKNPDKMSDKLKNEEMVRLNDVRKKLELKPLNLGDDDSLMADFKEGLQETLKDDLKKLFNKNLAIKDKYPSEEKDKEDQADKKSGRLCYERLSKKELEIVTEYIGFFETGIEVDPSLMYEVEYAKKKAEGIESPYPVDWYSKEEILEFLQKNYKKASSDEEKELDKKLKEILEYYPEAGAYYFKGTGSFFESIGMPEFIVKFIKDTYEI